jgi:hypothetical protein
MSDFIYLASQSPRRSQLLDQIGVAHTLLVAGPDEDAESLEAVLGAEAPARYVARVTGLKLDAAMQRMKRQGLPTAPVLCADTTVCLGREILGKPVDLADASCMLERLAGQSHRRGAIELPPWIGSFHLFGYQSRRIERVVLIALVGRWLMQPGQHLVGFALVGGDHHRQRGIEKPVGLAGDVLRCMDQPIWRRMNADGRTWSVAMPSELATQDFLSENFRLRGLCGLVIKPAWQMPALGELCQPGSIGLIVHKYQQFGGVKE